jgi:GNAT superfamily N-acetyltransferase
MSVLRIKTGTSIEAGTTKYIVKDGKGGVSYAWKRTKDLCEEEDNEEYIPKGYTKVLELSGVLADETGKGFGKELMEAFLQSADARKAELIYLDPVPGMGKNFDSKKTRDEQVNDLVRFYSRFGFRHNPKSATKRMWLVKKGSLKDSQLPT